MPHFKPASPRECAVPCAPSVNASTNDKAAPKASTLYWYQLPQQGFGAWVILYRHLARLTDWNITILLSQPIPPKLDSVQTRWRYPARPQSPLWNLPLWGRVPQAHMLRVWLEAQFYAMRLAPRPNAILNLFGVNSLLAGALASRLHLPLNLLLHDRWEVWTKPLAERHFMRRGRAAQILKRAARIWVVTSELAASYGLEDNRVRVLRPIPEERRGDFFEWRDAFQVPTIGFAGFVHDHHLAHFARLAHILAGWNGRLLIITDRAAKIRAQLGTTGNVEFHAPFERNADALEFLSQQSSALVVPCAFGDELEQAIRNKTNFPSKLVEYARSGLPILILAPPNVAVSNWAQAHAWLGYCNEPTPARLHELVSRLVARPTWEEMAQQTRAVPREEFDAAKIHAQFEREMLLR